MKPAFLPIAVFLAASLPAFATTRMLPKAEWLVPASSVIVVAKAAEVKTLQGTRKILGSIEGKPELVDSAISAQITRLAVITPVFGDVPDEPLLMNSSPADGLNHLTEGDTYLFFLADGKPKMSAYTILDAIPITDGKVYWTVDRIHLAPRALTEVISELKNFIAHHPQDKKP